MTFPYSTPPCVFSSKCYCPFHLLLPSSHLCLAIIAVHSVVLSLISPLCGREELQQDPGNIAEAASMVLEQQMLQGEQQKLQGEMIARLLERKPKQKDD